MELRLCPKCGHSARAFIGFEAGMIFECENCDYHGALTITAKSVEDAEYIRKKLAENDR